MLLNLPPELLLSVLKHLPVAGIVACRATSSAFRSFVDQHEPTIYRQAAAHPNLHLIPHGQVLLQDVPLLGWHSERFLGRLESWKDLCRRACEVRSSWLGRGPSRIRKYQNTSPDVHRIKVDEKRGFFIVTHHQGGLTVVNINDGNLVWSLPGNYIRPYAHCEYGEGFLIFDRFEGAKEVWRLVSDNPRTDPPDDFNVVPESLPDSIQQLLFDIIQSSGCRFKFLPHALLRPPDDLQTRAYRFVYPTLLTAAHETLLLWDVRTGKLVEQIDNIQRPLELNTEVASAGEEAGDVPMEQGGVEFSQNYLNNLYPEGDLDADGIMDYELVRAGSNEGVAPPHNTQAEDVDGLGDIHYVEVNDEYAFICGSNSLRVFRRKGSTPNDPPEEENAHDKEAGTCVLELTQSHIEHHGKWFFRVGYVRQRDLPKGFRSWRERRGERRYATNKGIPRQNDDEEVDDMSTKWNSTSFGQHQSEEEQPPLEGAISGPPNAVDEDSQMGDVDGDLDDDTSDQWNQENPVGGRDKHTYLANGIWWRTDKVVASHDTVSSRTCGSIHTTSEFKAAHVSPCGQHLAALLDDSRLFIIPYFERVITGQVKDVRDIKIDIQLNAHADSIYLAYEDGRIGVVTELAVFIIHPSFPDPSDLYTPPKIEVQRVVPLNDPSVLQCVSCLQMSSTALWLNWEIKSREWVLHQGHTRQLQTAWRKWQERKEAIHEEKFEISMDTGNIDLGLDVDAEAENSFVFSVDFGLGS